MFVSGGYSGFEVMVSNEPTGVMRDRYFRVAAWESDKLARQQSAIDSEAEAEFISKITDELQNRISADMSETQQAIAEVIAEVRLRVFGEGENVSDEDFANALRPRIDWAIREILQFEEGMVAAWNQVHPDMYIAITR